MNTKRILSIIAVVLTANLYAEQAPLIPLEDIFDPSAMGGVQISPNGEYISFKKLWNDRYNLYIRSVEDSSEKRITSEARRNVGEYHWVDDDTLVFLQDQDGNEDFQAHVIDREGKYSRNVTPFHGVKTNFVSRLKNDPDHILLAMNKRNPELFDLYKLNLRTYRLTQFMRNSGETLAWELDHNDVVRLTYEGNGVEMRLMYRDSGDESFRELLNYNAIDNNIDRIRFTADNDEFYARSNFGRDKAAIVLMDPENGKEIEVLYENENVDAYGIALSKVDRRPLRIDYQNEKLEHHYLDTNYESLIQSLHSHFPERELRISSTDDEERRYIVAYYSDRYPNSYYLYDLENDSLNHIGDSAPKINPDHLQPMKPIKYQARDGLTIHGYLTLPYESDERGKLPLIVLPHGGLVARDTWGTRLHVQFLANRGYAVLQPNYRVSSGYGKAFLKAGFKQSGKKIQNDITDGVQHLIAQGIVDPDRVAIMGGSYGGYATLAGLAFTPDLYACGVDIVGISNWFTLLESAPAYWKPAMEKIYEIIGHPEKDKELLTETSPLFHVDKMDAPLFVIQGAQDPRVPQREADQIVQALRAEGKQVAYMLKPDEGHGFRKKENTIEMFRAIEQFLAKHLGGRKEDAPDLLAELYRFQ